jgi:type IV secretion system protein VirB9
MRRRRAIMLGALLLATAPLAAAVVPAAGPGDPRIRWVHYDPDQVVQLAGTLGYQMTIEFGDDERIENVSIGDSLGWQITPNRKASLLFLKPIAASARHTDMTVVTSLRRYTFDLSAHAGRGRDATIYALRFVYPPPVILAAADGPPPKLLPKIANEAYSYRGSTATLPTRVFDDGHDTYFAFAEQADYPAILALDGKKQEESVNSAVRDGYVVVDQLAPAFVLRRGTETTTIINDGWHTPQPDALAPQPAKGKGR